MLNLAKSFLKILKRKRNEKGQTVKVTVSKGTQNVTVPKVIGLSEAEATAAIDKLKLVKNVKREYNSDVATGIVYSVDPGEGVSVAEGTNITLYVSKGQDLVTVPGIVGMSESAAEAQIEDSGLSVGRVTTSESDTVSAGLVISQSPTEGTQTERGTSINFVVSSGKPTPSRVQHQVRVRHRHRLQPQCQKMVEAIKNGIVIDEYETK